MVWCGVVVVVVVCVGCFVVGVYGGGVVGVVDLIG